MKSRGFTTIELVTMIVIIAILVVVMVPRFNATDYRGAQFRDQVVSSLRYAQKTATSHRRQVCVVVSTLTTMTFTIAPNPAAACNTKMLLPGSNSNVLQSPATSVIFTSGSMGFSFLPDGTATNGANVTVKISGQTDIVVIGATGYVN